ncbi:MAG: DNA repair protein RecN [Clostridia bacterium]|nr:DNA repair protein RecN [Clostridia bacterium]
MLKHISIKNVAVIEEVNIDFSSGLSVLTGETGAGKSIIIDSINLLKGERGSKSLIRAGEEKARVNGVFDVDTITAQKIADILGSDPETDVIISRELSSDGKNTIRINGTPANLAMLKSVGELLVNIHGQHDNTSLLSVKTHLGLLDSYGKEEIAPVLEKYRVLFEKCKELNLQISKLDTDEQEKLRRKDMLEFQIAELEEASLEIGEDEELLARKLVLDNAQKISENTRRAYDALYGGETGTAHDTLWEAINLLERISDFDSSINDVYSSLSEIADTLDEKVRDLRHISENLSFDGQEANEIEERLDLIQTLKRKYGSSIEEILEFYQNACTELKEIETSSERSEKLKLELEKSKKELGKLADELTDLRQKHAKALSQRIMTELADLNMAKVEFKVELTPCESFKPTGTVDAEFMVRTNVGEEIKPLAKIASGGELSRIMLAIKTVLRDTDTVKTSVFDEIDTGVSGMAAQKIGEKLRSMAKDSVVLCITHLPQIAALANNHYLISKSVTDGRTATKVTELDFDQRIDEIARTLGGASVTDITKENAKQLLTDAQKNNM